MIMAKVLTTQVVHANKQLLSAAKWGNLQEVTQALADRANKEATDNVSLNLPAS